MSLKQPSDNKNLAYYCQLFSSKLKVNSTVERGNAPHQPLLLLAVMELINKGLIIENKIYVSEELKTTFYNYRDILCLDTFSNSVSLPFFHLSKGIKAFWHLEFNEEYDAQKETNDKIRKSINHLNRYVKYAYFDNELFDFLVEDSSRQELVDTIFTYWFSGNQFNQKNILQINKKFQKYTQEELTKILHNNPNQEKDLKSYLKKTACRSALFREIVGFVYDYKCALCGLKITRIFKDKKDKRIHRIVDGAHIKPYAQSLDDRIQNGISLCKNHHWAFDKGWFTVCKEGKNYKSIVSDVFSEEGSDYVTPLKNFHNHKLITPILEELCPDPLALDWHREKIFQG